MRQETIAHEIDGKDKKACAGFKACWLTVLSMKMGVIFHDGSFGGRSLLVLTVFGIAKHSSSASIRGGWSMLLFSRSNLHTLHCVLHGQLDLRRIAMMGHFLDTRRLDVPVKTIDL
jgi:hypothetical protein